MKHVIITRETTGDQGTFGRLKVVETGFECLTGELPWRGNKREISCIPPGAYTTSFLARSASGKFKNVFHVQEVADRSGILIHAGNVCGDVALGFDSDVLGCILVGTRRGTLNGQAAVLRSRPVLKRLVKEIGKDVFKLFIWDQTDA